ncbi:MAG: hypothetical protein ACM359_20580 [Bacillota bacterium]
MLQYVADVVFPGDDVLERSRRVELYRQQVEAHEAVMRDTRFRQGPYARPVFCEQLKDQFPDGFATLKAAADFIGTKRSYLRNTISKGCRCKGYLFVYIDGSERVRIRTGRERPVRCLNDGIVKESLTDAARYGGITASALCMALREAQGAPAACGGRLWQYVNPDQPAGQQLYLFDVAPRPFRRVRYARQPKPQPVVVQLDLFEGLLGVAVHGVEHGESGDLVRGLCASAA